MFLDLWPHSKEGILFHIHSLLFDRDSGHKTFLEDVFENEARMIPGGNWGPASAPWTNVVKNLF